MASRVLKPKCPIKCWLKRQAHTWGFYLDREDLQGDGLGFQGYIGGLKLLQVGYGMRQTDTRWGRSQLAKQAMSLGGLPIAKKYRHGTH